MDPRKSPYGSTTFLDCNSSSPAEFYCISDPEAFNASQTPRPAVPSCLPGLLSNQGEKSINCYFMMAPLKKGIKGMVLQHPATRLGGMHSPDQNNM